MKRKNINLEERQKAIENTRELLKSTEDQIRIKELRINKLKSSNEFKKCDDVSSELRALLKEKGLLQSQLAVFERKEAKSKWYKKKKSSKSKTAKVTSSHASGKNPIQILDFLHRKSDAGLSTADSDESGDTLILENEELGNSQHFSQSPDHCQQELNNSQLECQQPDDSQHFQVPPLVLQ